MDSIRDDERISEMTEQMVENKAVADSYYQAGVRGDLPAFGDFLDENFTVTAPNYVPWGGTHHGAAFFRNALRDIGDIFDFSRFGYEELIAEGDHVVALLRVGVSGTDATVTITGPPGTARPCRSGASTSSHSHCWRSSASPTPR
jgi:ketosteroid isomerase-like protein